LKVASIDLGTNSFLLLVAEVSRGKIVSILEDTIQIVRIGERVNETCRLQPQALIRAEACFKDFRHLIDKHGVNNVLACATSAARDVENADELLSLGQKYNIPIKVISGEEEARLTYLGMIFDRDSKKDVVGLDIGGGSTELIFQDADRVVGRSINIGCVRLTEKFISKNPVRTLEQEKLRAYVQKEIQSWEKPQNFKEVIAVAGTPAALACVELGISFNAEQVHGVKLTRPIIQKWTAALAGLSVAERMEKYKMDRGRADVIIAGAIILDEVAAFLGIGEYTVSVYGARHGLALELSNA